MRPINKSAAKVLEKLTAGLAEGEARKVDTSSFMAVHVEHLWGRVFSVAHYYEQNGDLCQDPDMEFLRFAADAWIPLTFQQAQPGVYTQAVELDGQGEPKTFRPKAYADLRSFANMWLKNIREQQDLSQVGKPPKPQPQPEAA